MKNLIIRICGTAGEGVISSGDIFALAVARSEYYVTTFRSFPSEIRGHGQCSFQLRISEERAFTTGLMTDVLIGLNEEAILSNIKLLGSGGILIMDSDEVKNKFEEYSGVIKYRIPITTIATEKATIRAKNMVAIGVMAGLVPQLELKEQLKKDIKKRYAKKSQEIIDSNIKAFEEGYKYATENLKREDNLSAMTLEKSGKKLIMSGNEAIALAAIVAGCRFYSGYPITPATEIMEWLAIEMPKVNGTMLQCEDEISAVTAAIGASYGGVKSMTATSGPGFSLMSEALGLASMAELPLVVVDVQRGGPSTGLPTKTEQSDLNMAIYGTHGEAPKIVIAPMNVEDCFYQTINAFNFAEKYQLPVILLSDAAIGQRKECVDNIDLSKIHIEHRLKNNRETDAGLYVRYKNTLNGISPISSPGDVGCAYTGTGLEHTEIGQPCSKPEVHKMMTEKRFKKLETAAQDFIPAKTYGPDDAKIGIITWGGTTGAVLEAVDMAREQGYKIQALYPRTIYPVPNQWLNTFVEGKEMILVAEANYTAQLLHNLVYRLNKINKDIKLFEVLKYNGEPFSAREIFDKVDKIIREQMLKYTTFETEKDESYKF
jgi:2-oxoglutarate ferredoxin oxidoreductase subunit alpha